MHKAGFVNIVGNPNVGKSTLMNLLVGERISIATFKAQTTRHRIMGILNTDDAQIVFSDTPGVLKPNYKLQEAMLRFSRSALRDADVLLYVTDMVETPEKNIEFIDEVRKLDVPILVLINKIDLGNQEEISDKCQNAEDFETTLKFLDDIGCNVIQISAIGDIHPDIVAELVDKYRMDVCVTHKPYDRMKNDLDALIHEHDLIHCNNIGIGAMPGNIHETAEGVTGFITKCNEIAAKMGEKGKFLNYHNHAFEFEVYDGKRTFERLIDDISILLPLLSFFSFPVGGEFDCVGI